MDTIHFSQYGKPGEKIVITHSLPGPLEVHTHDYFEIFYVLSGEGFHTLNGTTYPISAGDIVFLCFHSYHKLEKKSEDFSWLNCLFLPEAIDAGLINSDTAEDILRLSLFAHFFEFQKINAHDLKVEKAGDEFDVLFREMLREYGGHARQGQEILKHYLIILLIKLFRLSAHGSTMQDAGADDNTMVNLVLEQLRGDGEDAVTMGGIARKAFLSPKYFSRLFKQKTGQTLTAFLQRERIKKACHLLQSTDLTIQEIIYRCGYRDSKFFYQLFRKTTGLTPAGYRRERRA